MSYNNNFIFRFKDIETSLIDRGEYVERFDALSLSTVDIEDSNNTTLTLAGFNKLVSALTTLLNEKCKSLLFAIVITRCYFEDQVKSIIIIEINATVSV